MKDKKTMTWTEAYLLGYQHHIEGRFANPFGGRWTRLGEAYCAGFSEAQQMNKQTRRHVY
jgi:hypothetical protein